jgi:hypothetical protein
MIFIVILNFESLSLFSLFSLNHNFKDPVRLAEKMGNTYIIAIFAPC